MSHSATQIRQLFANSGANGSASCPDGKVGAMPKKFLKLVECNVRDCPLNRDFGGKGLCSHEKSKEQ